MKAPVTESVEMALSLSAGGPLPRLTLLEAESDSLVQLQLKICSFCGGSDRRQLGRGWTHTNFTTGELNFVRAFSRMNKVACGSVVKNDLPAGENAAVEGG